MNKQIIVKKVWSLNPTIYKEMTLKEASEQYFDWCEYVIAPIHFHSGELTKSFIEWLETEI